MAPDESKRFGSFREFWPFYVSEHSRPLTRTLHFMGSTFSLALTAMAVVIGPLWLLAAVPLAGYGCAWIGHFFVEHNRPATFKYPFYSFVGDWVMYGKMLTGTMRDEVAKVTAERPA
jgi:hypothetical protein